MTTYMGWAKAVPNRTGEKAGGSSGVAVYRLSPMDYVHLANGELHKIKTAAERHIRYPEPEPRKSPLPAGAWHGKGQEPAGAKWGMSRDKLKALLHEGLTQRQIAKRTGIPYGSVAALIQRFKLSR